jgi:hypothetical protein
LNKQARINRAPFSKKALAYGLDLVSLLVLTIGFFYAVLYGVFSTGFGYSSNKAFIDNLEISHNYRLREGEDYKEYETVIKYFYFDEYTDRILKDINTDGKDRSIIYIYNVNVLGLPSVPTSTKNSSDFYKYKVDDDGNYLINELGERIPGSGTNYDKNISDFFYTVYNDIPVLARNYNNEYKKAFTENNTYESISRVSSFIFSFIVLYLVFPLIFKNGCTIFQKVFDVGYINYKDGYSIKKYKLIFRPNIYFLIPAFGLYFFNLYTVVLLVVVPIFINFLSIILSSEKRDLFDYICSVDTCEISQSLIYKDEKEEVEEEKENKNYEDKDFINKLSEIANDSVKNSKDDIKKQD